MCRSFALPCLVVSSSRSLSFGCGGGNSTSSEVVASIFSLVKERFCLASDKANTTFPWRSLVNLASNPKVVVATCGSPWKTCSARDFTARSISLCLGRGATWVTLSSFVVSRSQRLFVSVASYKECYALDKQVSQSTFVFALLYASLRFGTGHPTNLPSLALPEPFEKCTTTSQKLPRKGWLKLSRFL